MSVAPYVVHGLTVSYFTRKVTGYLDFAGLPWRLQPSIGANAVAREAGWNGGIPVVTAPDGELMWDSTAVIVHLDAAGPTAGRPSVLPDDPTLRYLAFLLDDFSDEWFYRHAVGTRWLVDENTVTGSWDIAREGSREVRLPIADVRAFVTDAMSGLPSIVAGLLVFTVYVDGRGFSGLAGSIALMILMLPTVTRTSEEILRTIPDTLREASLALGAPQWRVVLRVVVPTALTGLVTATILGVARAIGETAPVKRHGQHIPFGSIGISAPQSGVDEISTLFERLHGHREVLRHPDIVIVQKCDEFRTGKANADIANQTGDTAIAGQRDCKQARIAGQCRQPRAIRRAGQTDPHHG